MNSSWRDMEEGWREKQQVKESWSQRGQKGSALETTPRDGNSGSGMEKEQKPRDKGKDLVLPS